MRGLGLSFLVRRARSSWLLLACVAVTVLLTTGLAAALWTYATAVVPPGALDILAAPQGRVIGLSGVAMAGDAAADTPLIRAALRKAWPGVGFQMESALWANPIQLSTSAAGTSTVQIQPASLQAISAHATLTVGEWPPPPQHGRPLPVALPAVAAARLRLTVGSVLTGTTQASGAPTALRVTGLFRPRDTASPYWVLDLLPVSGISVQNGSVFAGGNSAPSSSVIYGPAVLNPAAFDGPLAAWRRPPPAGRYAGQAAVSPRRGGSSSRRR